MNTRKVLREYSYRPRKAYSQNFLVNERLQGRICQLAHLEPEDTVVEIGAGPGNLTRRLARFADKVYAIESEEELTLILKAELKADNVEVILADALKIDYSSLCPPGGKLKLVANLPYNITTPLLFKLLETPEIFSEMLILVQAEVASRIAAKPGNRSYGLLSIFTQLLSEASIVLDVGPEVFKPRPKVNSSLIRLKILERPRAEIDDPLFFKRLVRTAFNKRRKTFKNAIVKSHYLGIPVELLLEALESLNIEPERRPETLSIEEYAALANLLCKSIPVQCPDTDSQEAS